MNKKIVVDIDATLWDLVTPWHEELLKINPSCPVPGANGNWDFYEGYMSETEAMAACLKVHMRQYEYAPYAGASSLVRMIRMAGYDVVIASHRDPSTIGSTMRMLSDHNVGFDDVYVGWNKHPLLELPETVLFIDDNPKSQDHAVEHGVEVISLKYGYNEHNKNKVILCDSFSELRTSVAHWIHRDKSMVGC